MYVRIGDNITDKDIEWHVRDVMNYDIVPILPDAMLRQIEVYVVMKIQQWNKNQPYSIGNYTWLKNIDGSGNVRKWYKAIADSTNSQPHSANWVDLELMNFVEDYLHPLMAQMFFYRFAAYHGINIAQHGMVTPNDPQGTFTPTTDAQRGGYLGDSRNKLNIELARMNKKLSEVDYTFDGVKYGVDRCEDVKIRPKAKIFALGQSKYDRRLNLDKWPRDYPY